MTHTSRTTSLNILRKLLRGELPVYSQRQHASSHMRHAVHACSELKH